MKMVIQFIERRPLTISVFALLASLPSIGLMVALGNTGFHFDRNALAVSLFTLSISLIALINLIRADKRGYSSTKIGLSVTALFFAFFPEICLTAKLLSYIGEN
jgi:hypothetical protein